MANGIAAFVVFDEVEEGFDAFARLRTHRSAGRLASLSLFVATANSWRRTLPRAVRGSGRDGAKLLPCRPDSMMRCWIACAFTGAQADQRVHRSRCGSLLAGDAAVESRAHSTGSGSGKTSTLLQWRRPARLRTHWSWSAGGPLTRS